MTLAERVLSVLGDGRPRQSTSFGMPIADVVCGVRALREQGHDVKSFVTSEWDRLRSRKVRTYWYRLVPAALPEPSSVSGAGPMTDGGSGSSGSPAPRVEGSSSVGGNGPSTVSEPVQLSLVVA